MTEREREVVCYYRDELRELVSTSEQNFEKQLSYIAGGGLALTFVLVEKLIGSVSDSTYPWILYMGWFTLAACLLVNLWSQKIAAEVHSSNMAEFNAALMLEDDVAWHDGCYDQKRCEDRKVKIAKWNKASIALLFAGISFILLFTIINLTVQKSVPSNSKTVSIFENKPLQSMSMSNDTIQKPSGNDLSKGLNGSALPVFPPDPHPAPGTGPSGTPLPAIPSTPVKR